jgi:hypothetical protein
MVAAEVVLVLLHIIGAVHWTPEHKKAECVVFRSAEEMEAAWIADGGKKENVPQRFNEVGEIKVFDEDKKKGAVLDLDFDKTMVLAVFAGEKPTGGYRVRIERVVHDAAKQTVWVLYREISPGARKKPNKDAVKAKLREVEAATEAEDFEKARRLADEANALMKVPEPEVVTQVLTYPSHVVAVKKVPGEVRFAKVDSREGLEVEGAVKARGK